MTKQYQEPISIRVRFHGHVVTLADMNDRQTTPEGVQIWIQSQPAGCFRPMADIPEGTLEIYKHCRPQIIQNDWSE
jgi:hypothetical protein